MLHIHCITLSYESTFSVILHYTCTHSVVVIHESGDITLKHHHAILQGSFELWLDPEEHALYLDDLLMEVGPEVTERVHTLQIIGTHLYLVLLKQGVALL